MALPAINREILSTLERSQEIGNPFALIRTFSDEFFLVRCFDLIDDRLTKIDFSKGDIPKRLVTHIPSEMVDRTYTSRSMNQSFEGIEVLVNATFLYPNQQIICHQTILEQNYCCHQCAKRIASLQILTDIFSSRDPLLTAIISLCILKYIGLPITPTPSQPSTPKSNSPPRSPIFFDLTPKT